MGDSVGIYFASVVEMVQSRGGKVEMRKVNMGTLTIWSGWEVGVRGCTLLS